MRPSAMESSPSMVVSSSMNPFCLSLAAASMSVEIWSRISLVPLTRESIPRVPFWPLSLRAKVTTLFSMSLPPISNLRGTPLISQSKNLLPGRSLRSSTFTRMPPRLSSAATFLQTSVTSSALSFLKMGMMTTCWGAMAGGSLRPVSSAWTPMTAPRRRSVIPRVVWCTFTCSPDSVS